jgi:hypothetical protein
VQPIKKVRTVPTAQLEALDYVIDARANEKLNEFSGDLAKILLELASRLTHNRTSQGVPLVDVCDIEAAASVLCSAIKRGVQSGDLPDQSGEVLEHLEEVCKAFAHECEESRASSMRSGKR